MTDSDWREAFRRRIAVAGYSARSLSIAAGLSPTAIGDILRGRSRTPRHQTLYRIASVLGCTPEELVDPNFIPEITTSAATAVLMTAHPSTVFQAAGEGLPMHRVPFLDTDAIRSQASESDWTKGEVGLPSCLVATLRITKPAVLEAPDDAMSPTIHRGDLLLIDRGIRDVSRDGIYVLARPGQITVRRLRLDPITDHVTVLADNPDYIPQNDVSRSEAPVFALVLWQGRTL